MGRLPWIFALSLLLPEGALASEAVSGAASSRQILNGLLEWVSMGIEAAGVAIILAGAIIATSLFLYGGLGSVGWPSAFRGYRANLGRGILLGLELLVAADIIGTVAVTPSLENLAVLAAIVAMHRRDR